MEIRRVELLASAVQKQRSTSELYPPWAILDLNQRLLSYQDSALTTELIALLEKHFMEQLDNVNWNSKLLENLNRLAAAKPPRPPRGSPSCAAVSQQAVGGKAAGRRPSKNNFKNQNLFLKRYVLTGRGLKSRKFERRRRSAAAQLGPEGGFYRQFGQRPQKTTSKNPIFEVFENIGRTVGMKISKVHFQAKGNHHGLVLKTFEVYF